MRDAQVCDAHHCLLCAPRQSSLCIFEFRLSCVWPVVAVACMNKYMNGKGIISSLNVYVLSMFITFILNFCQSILIFSKHNKTNNSVNLYSNPLMYT